jgi:diadenosine tetraphosphate (Ap4A) HIT family hydrolase
MSMMQGMTEFSPKTCAFCTLPSARVIDENATTIAIRDGYPVSPGHTLLIPIRHTGSFFDLSSQERSDLMTLLDRAKLVLDEEFQPQGYNIGINDGAAAGQTVPHLHVHLIPRFDGDLPDPRGGVRWVIPDKAKYWP